MKWNKKGLLVACAAVAIAGWALPQNPTPETGAGRAGSWSSEWIEVTAANGVVEAGDVCTLEPGVYVEGEWGLRVENDYLVGADGVTNLFDYPRELEYFVIGGTR